LQWAYPPKLVILLDRICSPHETNQGIVSSDKQKFKEMEVIKWIAYCSNVTFSGIFLENWHNIIDIEDRENSVDKKIYPAHGSELESSFEQWEVVDLQTPSQDTHLPKFDEFLQAVKF